MSDTNEIKPQDPTSATSSNEPPAAAPAGKWTWAKGVSKRGLRPPVGGRALPGCRPEPVLRHLWQKGKFKVDYILKAEHRQEYEALLSDSKSTVSQAWQWLKERGYEIGYCAVMSHRREFIHDLRELQKAGKLAATFAKEAESCGGEDAFPAAALTRVQMIAMDRLFRSTAGAASAPQDELSIKELAELTKIVATGVNARNRLQQLRRAVEEARILAAARPDKRNPEALVNRVREILGIPLGDDDT